jgi:hypothetical protein
MVPFAGIFPANSYFPKITEILPVYSHFSLYFVSPMRDTSHGLINYTDDNAFLKHPRNERTQDVSSGIVCIPQLSANEYMAHTSLPSGVGGFF